MRNLFILIILFSIVSHTAHSQVGIMGKRFLLKTDIVNGIRRPITSIELETAVNRKLAISLSYSITKTPINGIFKGSNFINWMEVASSKTWNKYLPDYEREQLLDDISNYELIDFIRDKKTFNSNVHITTNQRLFGISLNFYNGGAISAPFGKYFQMGFKAGKQYLSGYFNVPYLTTDPSSSFKNLTYNGVKRVTFNQVGVRLISLFMGGGRNHLLHPRIMLDINYGATINITQPLNSNDIIFSSMVAHKNGANLLAHSDRESRSSVNAASTPMNIGLYFNVKFGILLF